MEPSPSIQALLDAAGQIPPGRVLVAVSGGPDSVALLRALAGGSRELRIGHVNHMLRGQESDADEAFVRQLGSELGIDVEVAQVDTEAEARGTHGSLEATARRLRYAALQSMLESWPGDLIATAHTEDDQAETLILRLLRGGGTGGLGGMAARRGALIRPFLTISHATVLQALDTWKQPYQIDSSNRDPRFLRNRVRHDLLPVMASMRPGILPVLARAARLLRMDADYLDGETERAFRLLRKESGAGELVLSRAGWMALHPALQAHVARLVIRVLLGHVQDMDESHIAGILESIREGRDLKKRLPHGLNVDISPREVTVHLSRESTPETFAPATMAVPGAVETEAGTLEAERVSDIGSARVEQIKVVAGPLHALCDADLVGPELTVRPRRPGDRIRPPGSGGSRKLQDILVDAHVPVALRDSVPVIENGRGIVWIAGFAVDSRAAISPATTRILHLRWRPEGGEYRGTMLRSFSDK